MKKNTKSEIKIYNIDDIYESGRKKYGLDEMSPKQIAALFFAAGTAYGKRCVNGKTESIV